MESTAPERFRTMVLGIIAMLGLVLAAVGISGVTYRGVVDRTKEFAVRLALGSQPGARGPPGGAGIRPRPGAAARSPGSPAAPRCARCWRARWRTSAAVDALTTGVSHRRRSPSSALPRRACRRCASCACSRPRCYEARRGAGAAASSPSVRADQQPDEFLDERCRRRVAERRRVPLAEDAVPGDADRDDLGRGDHVDDRPPGQHADAHTGLDHFEDALGQLQVGHAPQRDAGRAKHLLDDEAVVDRAGVQVELFRHQFLGRHQRRVPPMHAPDGRPRHAHRRRARESAAAGRPSRRSRSPGRDWTSASICSCFSAFPSPRSRTTLRRNRPDSRQAARFPAPRASRSGS